MLAAAVLHLFRISLLPPSSEVCFFSPFLAKFHGNWWWLPVGSGCGSDHELLITKFRLKLKKVGKTTRPFRYDLNQIPYDYTVEVRNRFKGLDLIDRVPDELWTEVRDIVQETGIKIISMEKKCKKLKWLSGEVLEIARKE